MEVTAKCKITEEGYIAYCQRDDDNPYDVYLMPAHHELWEYGWYEAYNEDMEN